MKIRSLLLVVCLVVVPLIAMFSHRVPPGTRATVGAFLGQLAGAVRPVASGVPAAASPTPAAGSPLPPPQPIAPPADAAAPAAVAAPPVVPVAAYVPEGESLSRLRALGAVAIDCRPLDGRAVHVASCRLPVDAAGQLERLFQATGPDAAAATDRLLRDVTAWRSGAGGGQPGSMRF